ncbi:MAG: nucleotidyl transferase, partial [Chloroflexi bacterium]|nr:nucleotidyl transferase [Chloroflexota bacterium]
TTFYVDGWHDCGDYDALLQTNRILLSRIQASKDDDIHGSIIIHPVSIADSAVIENSIIGPYVSIADGVKIYKSIIEDSIIEENADIRNALVKESLIGRNAVFNGQSSRLNIGDYSKVMNVRE